MNAAVRPLPADWASWMASGAWRGREETSVPMLPELAGEVSRVASDPDVTISWLTRVTSKDPVLASRVLRMANSAFSAPAQEITTIRDAIVRLGTFSVRNVVLSVCFTSRLQDPKTYGRHGRELIDHAIGTAYMARLVAERCGVDAEEAFLYGLLHDIGKFLIYKLAHDYARLTGQPAPDAAEVASVVEAEHARLGGLVLRHWQVPEALDEPVMTHHDPTKAKRYPVEARVAHLADRLSHRYGFGCEPDLVPFDSPHATELELDAAWLEATDARAPGLFRVAREILT